MKSFKIKKPCPFCPINSYTYIYKTWYGLFRHVQKDHLKVLSRKRGFEYSWWNLGSSWKKGKLIFIRCWEMKYSKYFDIDIKNPDECERYLLWYVTENPSFRKKLKVAQTFYSIVRLRRH